MIPKGGTKRGDRRRANTGELRPTSLSLPPFLVLSLSLLAISRGLTPTEVVEVMVREAGLEAEIAALRVVVTETQAAAADELHSHGPNSSPHRHRWGHESKWQWQIVLGETVVEYGYRKEYAAAVEEGRRVLEEIVDGVREIDATKVQSP